MTRTKAEQEQGQWKEQAQAAAVADNIYGQVTWQEEEVEEAEQDNTGHKTKANATKYANADAKLRQLAATRVSFCVFAVIVSSRISSYLLSFTLCPSVSLSLCVCVCVWADICNFILPRTTNNGTAGGHSSPPARSRPRPSLIRTWCLLNASWATLDKGAKPLGGPGA